MPCGYYGDPVKECSCSATAIARYQKRISGLLLDRIDIRIIVAHENLEEFYGQGDGGHDAIKRAARLP